MFLICKVIGGIPAAASSFINKIFCQFSVFFFSCIFIQLKKRQFDFFMPRRIKSGGMFFSENTVNQVHIFFCDIQKLCFSGGVCVSNRSLNQMPCAVKLVIRPSGKTRFRLHHSEIYIQISILILIVCHPFDQFVYLLFQAAVPLLLKEIRCPLDPFGHIGFPEYMRFKRHSLFPAAFKRLKSPCFLKAIIHRSYCLFPEQILLLFPKATGYIYLVKCDFFSVRFHIFFPYSKRRGSCLLRRGAF